MTRRYVAFGVFFLACFVAASYFVSFDNELRGGALESALQPIVDAKDADASVVAKAILENYRETRQIAALWSGLYWGFSWVAAILSALAAVFLKLESMLSDEKVRKDLAAFLSVAAALLVTISTSGDFQRKWQANRAASAEIERIGYDFLEHRGAEARGYLAAIGDSLQRRHAAILGTDQRRSAVEPGRAASAGR